MSTDNTPIDPSLTTNLLSQPTQDLSNTLALHTSGHSDNANEMVNDEDVDTSYITLDFGDNPPQNLITAPLNLRFTGLDTDTPFVQVGELFFRGRWMDLIGTEMIVGKGEGKVIGMTRRRLALERVGLQRKGPP